MSTALALTAPVRRFATAPVPREFTARFGLEEFVPGAPVTPRFDAAAIDGPIAEEGPCPECGRDRLEYWPFIDLRHGGQRLAPGHVGACPAPEAPAGVAVQGERTMSPERDELDNAMRLLVERWLPYLNLPQLRLVLVLIQRGYHIGPGFPRRDQSALYPLLHVGKERMYQLWGQLLDMGLIEEGWQRPGFVVLKLNLDAVPAEDLQPVLQNKRGGRRGKPAE